MMKASGSRNRWFMASVSRQVTMIRSTGAAWAEVACRTIPCGRERSTASRTSQQSLHPTHPGQEMLGRAVERELAGSLHWISNHL